jgi:hypothetical protein
MESLFNTGIRPIVDQYLKSESEKIRNYGEYWSASSAGYCLRLNILKRLKVPCVPEIQEDLPRTTRVFESGKIFHEWAQRITKNAGLSIAQELELQDKDLMVRGHIDDLVLITTSSAFDPPENAPMAQVPYEGESRLVLYDYKTANSQSFNYKRDEIGHYHKMQLGTYMYMLRKDGGNSLYGDNVEAQNVFVDLLDGTLRPAAITSLSEGRILTISKDDLRMREHQLMWSPDLEKEIVGYWKTLQGYWNAGKLPACTCLNYDGGFMSKRSKKGKVYNPYFYNDTPCSLEWVSQFDEFKEFIKKGESK